MPNINLDHLQGKTYEELLLEKDKLVAKLKVFENNRKKKDDEYEDEEDDFVNSADTLYEMDLLYLAALCNLICAKFELKCAEEFKDRLV